MRTDSFPFCFLLVAFLLFPLAGVSDAGIPEPETVIWGKVFNTVQGNRIEVTEGSVEWTLRARDGGQRSHQFATEVECLDCNAYENGECVDCDTHAYMLRVPQEAVIAVAGMEVGDDAIPLTEIERQYDHMDARINGSVARIIPKSPEWKYIRAGQPRRSAYYEADLEFVSELGDTDGDGIPDWWETEHGLNSSLPDDAEEDADGDGWTNLDEFGRGTDPTRSNATPSLLNDTLTAYEGGTVMFRPEIADSDTPPESLRIRFMGFPPGIRLVSNGGESHGKPLTARATVTLADLEAGRVLLEQTALGNDDPVMSLELSDGIHGTVTASLRLAIFRPSLTDGTDAAYWADAYHYSRQRDGGAETAETLPDRSGNDFAGGFHRLAGGDPTGSEIRLMDAATPSGRPAIELDGTGWFELPYASPAFPDGDVTLFTVFRSSGRKAQVLSSGPFFEVGITAADHPSHPRELFTATSTEAVYGNRGVGSEWHIATIHRSAGETRVDLDGLCVGGPYSHEGGAELGTDPVVGSRNEWIYNFTDEAWEFEAHDMFDGELAEMLVFGKDLPETGRWQIHAYLLSKWFGHAVSDFSASSRPVILAGASGYEKLTSEGYSYEADFAGGTAADRPHILIGGHGDDELVGGYEDDILVGGPGADAFMGFGGQDIFVVDDGDTVWDLNLADGDLLYLSHLIQDTGRALADHLRFEISPQADGDNWTLLRVDSEGDGQDDAVISLASVVFRDTDLDRLWAGGHLHTGGPRPGLRIGLEPKAGSESAFRITFSGGQVPEGMTLRLGLDGEADGAAYPVRAEVWNALTAAYEPRVFPSGVIPVSLKPGDTSLTAEVLPRAGLPEGEAEAVDVTLLPVPEIYDLAEARAVSAVAVGDGSTPLPIGDSHSADYNPADHAIGLGELLRVIQLYNTVTYGCDPAGEDGYRADDTGDHMCAPHASDYNPQDWRIGLNELLRLIQIYNSGGYEPDPMGEDGFSVK